MSSTLQLLGSFFPPDLSINYLLALLPLMAESLALVFAAMTLAYAVSLPLAVLVAIRVPGAAALTNALSLLRTIPDLTLAILCVIIFGLGAGAGMIALFLYYTAAVTKMFADLLETAPRRPLEALEATGAPPLVVALFGLLPLTRVNLFAYGAFAFECALRSSVVVGAVGGGGIGAELLGSLAAFDFQRAATQILLLVIVIAALDHAALALRERPYALLALLPVGLLAVWHTLPGLFAARHAVRVLFEMMPPTIDATALAALPELVWETVWMALTGTAGGAVAGVIAAAAASRLIAPWWIVIPVRRALELFRTVPEVVWGLVLVAVTGMGPLAGAFALGLHSFGSLGRLFADEFDATPAAPRYGIAQTGGSWCAVFLYATVPLAFRQMATHLLFRLDWNLRMATVMGLIGAGGIGQALYQAQQLFFYRQVLAYILVTAALVLAFDWLSAQARARLNDTPLQARRRTVTVGNSSN